MSLADDPSQLRQIIAELQRLGMQVLGSRAAVNRHRVREARKMLDAGMRRAEIVPALQERFGVCRRSAYQIINRALNIRRPPRGR